MNARIQTWFPFWVQVCVNGGEWLARAMDRAGIRYQRAGNCFAWVEDAERVQCSAGEARIAPARPGGGLGR